MIPAFIYSMDRSEAVVAMVDSNLHREKLLPSEKAFAYKMKMDAIKHQGTSGHPGQKWTRDSLAEGANDSSRQIHRYIRLTNLIPGILQKADSGEIALTPAVELSYLDKDTQEIVLDAMEQEDCTPSYSQAVRMKKLYKTVQTNLGHATASFTLDVYGHVTQKIKNDSAERMQQFFNAIRVT